MAYLTPASSFFFSTLLLVQKNPEQILHNLNKVFLMMEKK